MITMRFLDYLRLFHSLERGQFLEGLRDGTVHPGARLGQKWYPSRYILPLCGDGNGRVSLPSLGAGLVKFEDVMYLTPLVKNQVLLYPVGSQEFIDKGVKERRYFISQVIERRFLVLSEPTPKLRVSVKPLAELTAAASA